VFISSRKSRTLAVIRPSVQIFMVCEQRWYHGKDPFRPLWREGFFYCQKGGSRMNDNEGAALPPKYNPQEVEKGRYQFWLDGDFFEAKDDETKEPYTIVIPPPNVTGKLHLGH